MQYSMTPPHAATDTPSLTAVFEGRKRLIANGWHPIPVRAKVKEVTWKEWGRWLTEYPTDSELVAWSNSGCTSTGVGLADTAGGVVAIDIDVDDATCAREVATVAWEVFGPTPFIRFRETNPRIAMFYRLKSMLAMPHGKRAGAFWFPSAQTHFKIEVLTSGRQILIDGTHPLDGKPWRWMAGKSPYDLPLSAAPEVNEINVHAFFQKLASQGIVPATEHREKRNGDDETVFSDQLWENGKVVDGRDSYIMKLALDFARLHPDDESRALERTWDAVQKYVDLTTPKGADGSTYWTYEDVASKVAYRMKYVNGPMGADTIARSAAEMFGPAPVSQAVVDNEMESFLRSLGHVPVTTPGRERHHPDEADTHVTGLAYRGKVHVHVQGSGTGKTSLYASLAVAAKYGWKNHRAPRDLQNSFGFKVHPKATFLLISLEGGSSIREATNAFLLDNGMDGPSATPVRPDAMVTKIYPQSAGLWVRMGAFNNSPPAYDEVKWGDFRKTLALIRRVNPDGPIVAVWDNINMAIGAENVSLHPQVWQAFVARLENEMNADGNMSTVLLHHLTKAGDAAGHQQIYNLSDRYTLGHTDPNDRSNIYLYQSKQRGMKNGFIYVRMRSVRMPETTSCFPDVSADDREYFDRVLNYGGIGAYADSFVMSAAPPEWLVDVISGKKPSKSADGGTGKTPNADGMTRSANDMFNVPKVGG